MYLFGSIGIRTQNIQKFQYGECKTISTPLSTHVKLRKNECPKSDDEKEFIRKISYHLLFVVSYML